MPRSRRLLALVPAPFHRRTDERLTASPTALLAAVALLTFVTAAAGAQASASDTPLHLAASRFEFVASGDTQPLAKPLAAPAPPPRVAERTAEPAATSPT